MGGWGETLLSFFFLISQEEKAVVGERDGWKLSLPLPLLSAAQHLFTVRLSLSLSMSLSL